MALIATPTLARNQTPEERQQAALQRLRNAIGSHPEQQCQVTVDKLRSIIAKDAVDLPPQILGPIYELGAYCAYSVDRRDEAYGYLLAGTALADSSNEIWAQRFTTELFDKRYDAAVDTIYQMTQGHGAALNALDIKLLYQLVRELKRAGKSDRRRQLLSLLTTGGYDPDAPDASVDRFRFSYAQILSEEGKSAEVATQIDAIKDPGTLQDVLFDPLLRKTLPTGFDLRQQVERGLSERKVEIAQNPNKIGPVNEAAGYLRALGRPQEALTLLDTLKARMSDTTSFEDADRWALWWWDERSRANMMLGNQADSFADLRAGAKFKEYDQLNVSQVINLSQIQLDVGRSAEALETIAAFEKTNPDVSPFGMMQIKYAHGCALVKLGRTQEAAADIAYMRDHEKDAPTTLVEMLACVDDLDGAATALIRQLDNSDQRGAALKVLADYDVPPVALPPTPIGKHLPALKARADVRAAIDRVGGVPRIPLQDVSF